jgi:Tol biopolymer transport system component
LVVYDSQLEDGRSRIFNIDGFDGQRRRLTRSTDVDDEALPTWSRDGKSIYFRSLRSGRGEIWRAPVGGGEPVQMTRTGGSAAWESWDGNTLYFTRARGNNRLRAAPGQRRAGRARGASRRSWRRPLNRDQLSCIWPTR